MIESLALMQWDSPATYYYVGLTLFFSYLVGSIPFGLIFAWMAGAGDVRKLGSGNIGATNVLRTGNKLAAAATLFCDAAKGYICVSYAGDYFGMQVFPALAALGAFLGHLFPLWLRFKGGKGVATFIGICFALAWPAALMTCGSWLITARATRYSSLAALVATCATPLYFLILGATLFAALTALLAALIVFAHRANIARLLKGTEPKIGAR